MTNLGSKTWLCGLLCDTLASQWWLHFLHCLATDHSLLGTLLSTSVLLSVIPSLLLLTPPLWRAFYCTMVRRTVLRGKSLSPYMAQYSPIAEHQGDCLQYTQSGDGGLTRETAVTHSSSGQFSTNQEPTNLIQWLYNFILWFFFSVDYHYYTKLFTWPSYTWQPRCQAFPPSTFSVQVGEGLVMGLYY